MERRRRQDRAHRNHDRGSDDGCQSRRAGDRLGFRRFHGRSLAWTMVGASSGQINLLATNGFLTLVNLVGIWRWLGRHRAYDDGGESAKSACQRASAPSLFTATGIAGTAVVDDRGEPVETGVEALIACANSEISNVVVAGGGMGGAGEELRAVPRGDVRFSCDRLALTIGAPTFVALDKLQDGSWPANARAMTSGLSACVRSLGVFAEARHQPFQRTL